MGHESKDFRVTTPTPDARRGSCPHLAKVPSRSVLSTTCRGKLHSVPRLNSLAARAIAHPYAAVAVCLGLVSMAGHASAQHSSREGATRAPQDHANAPADATPDGDDAQSVAQRLQASRDAREHFTAGMTHFRAREFRPAIQEFEAAAALVPSADLWFNIARAHEELGDQADAIDFYQRYLRDRVDPPDAEEVQATIVRLRSEAEAIRLASDQRPTTGTLRLRVSETGASIALDDQSVGQSPLDVPMPLEPGSHRLELTRDGYVPFRASVDIERGVTSAAYAQLEPETRYRAIRGRRLFTWIVGGLALASTGLSVGLGIRAASLESNGDARASDWARSSDYALGGAMAAGVAAVILYFVEGRSVGTERIGPDQTAATARRGEPAARAQGHF